MTKETAGNGAGPDATRPAILPEPFDHANFLRRRAMTGMELRGFRALEARRDSHEISRAEFEAAVARLLGRA